MTSVCTTEQWKPMVGFETQMMISNYGAVKSYKKHTGWSAARFPAPTDRGYCEVRPSKDGKKVHVSVHRAVWEAFNGPIPETKSIDHIDRNRSNNALCNLKAATDQEQRANTVITKRRRDGRPIFVWKVTEDEHQAQRFLNSYDASAATGCGARQLRSVANGKAKRAGVYRSRWADSGLQLLEGECFRTVHIRGSPVTVSNLGRLLDSKTRAFATVPLATDGNGYPTVGTHSTLMHRVVAQAWPELIEGTCGPDKTIDHKDRNVNNNRADNLKWATAKEQAANRSSSFVHTSAAPGS